MPRDWNQYLSEATGWYDNVYNPQVDAQRNWLNEVTANYNAARETTNKNLPLISQRYDNALAEIDRQETAGKEDIARSETQSIGGIKTREANRGNYGGSVENSEVLNTQTEFGRIINELLAQTGEGRLAANLQRDESTLDIEEFLSDQAGKFSSSKMAINNYINELLTTKATGIQSMASQNRQFDADSEQRALDNAARRRAYQLDLEQSRAQQARWASEDAKDSSGATQTGIDNWVALIADRVGEEADHETWTTMWSSGRRAMDAEGVDSYRVYDKLMGIYPGGPAKTYWQSPGIKKKRGALRRTGKSLSGWGERLSRPIGHWFD